MSGHLVIKYSNTTDNKLQIPLWCKTPVVPEGIDIKILNGFRVCTTVEDQRQSKYADWITKSKENAFEILNATSHSLKGIRVSSTKSFKSDEGVNLHLKCDNTREELAPSYFIFKTGQLNQSIIDVYADPQCPQYPNVYDAHNYFSCKKILGSELFEIDILPQSMYAVAYFIDLPLFSFHSLFTKALQ